MDVDNPGSQVIDAVESAVKWFNQVKITGVREDRVCTAPAGK